MKKYYLLLTGSILLAALQTTAQTKIGAAGAPDGSAMLEVTSGTGNNKGLLPPRMTTTQRNAITNPATGLLLYNTTTNQMQVNTGTPASPIWTVATATTTGWSTTGNTGTTPATNFIGTTDNQPLSLRTNNTEKMRVTETGSVGIGTNAPLAKLHVVDTGNATIVVASSTSSASSIALGNNHHGISRNLNNAGGGANDVALYTTSGSPSTPASIHLGVRANVTDTLDLKQFVLKSTGYVGIGTNTPAAKLHVTDTTDVAIRLAATSGHKMSVDFGSPSHGVARNLTNSGGLGNDVALYTSSGPTAATEGTLYLASNPINSDSIPLTQFALKKNGNIGIGTNAPTAKLSVNGTTNNLSGTWGIFSDVRVKTIDGEYEDGLATVMKIHPVKFHYNANAPFKSTEQQIGIIAQEMEQIAPYMVSKINADGFTDLRQYNNQALPYMLVNAIQEQQAQIEALKAKNEQLEAANKVTAQLMERVKQMEQMIGIKEIEGTAKVAGK